MKIITTTAFAFALASLTALAAATDDVAFNGTAELDGDSGKNGKPKPPRIKTAANLMGVGATIQLCPSGDCAIGQAIMLAMTRLQEIDNSDDTNKPFVQEAKNFNALTAKWTAFEPTTFGGVDAVTTSFFTKFKVGVATTDTSFNLTATIFKANGTAMNGNQTINVPAGALKFSVMITDWPFKNPANRLRFGVELKAQGKNKMERDPGSKKPKGGPFKDIDRVDMGEGMFMDAPTLAVVDDVTTPINASVNPQDKKMELVWIFPSFKKSLYYDPVLGSTDPSASVTDTSSGSTNGSANGTVDTTASGTPAGTPATTPATTLAPTTPSPTSGSGVVSGVFAASFLAVVGALLG